MYVYTYIDERTQDTELNNVELAATSSHHLFKIDSP